RAFLGNRLLPLSPPAATSHANDADAEQGERGGFRSWVGDRGGGVVERATHTGAILEAGVIRVAIEEIESRLILTILIQGGQEPISVVGAADIQDRTERRRQSRDRTGR